eukprot:3786_1
MANISKSTLENVNFTHSFNNNLIIITTSTNEKSLEQLIAQLKNDHRRLEDDIDDDVPENNNDHHHTDTLPLELIDGDILSQKEIIKKCVLHHDPQDSSAFVHHVRHNSKNDHRRLDDDINSNNIFEHDYVSDNNNDHHHAKHNVSIASITHGRGNTDTLELIDGHILSQKEVITDILEEHVTTQLQSRFENMEPQHELDDFDGTTRRIPSNTTMPLNESDPIDFCDNYKEDNQDIADHSDMALPLFGGVIIDEPKAPCPTVSETILSSTPSTNSHEPSSAPSNHPSISTCTMANTQLIVGGGEGLSTFGFDLGGSAPTQQMSHKKMVSKRYLCSDCEHSFTSKAHLDAHKRTHNGIRPYVCVTCNKRFKQWNHLNAHSVTHAAVKPYFCVTCERRFTRKASLARHQNKFKH